MCDNVFQDYWTEVATMLGKPPQKGCAIHVSKNRLDVLTDEGMLRLYEALDCPGWVGCKGANWAWRTDAPDFKTETDEVKLERTIINSAKPLHEWTCQMSTSSGIQGPNKHKRRAIDLVRKRAENCYDFIELKVESDNPLYAAFEILGYALAYIHARKNGNKGSGDYDVMCAKKICLVVLGPTDWYKYKQRDARGAVCELQFEGLARRLEESLNKLAKEILKADISFSFSFKKFTWCSGNIQKTVESICAV